MRRSLTHSQLQEGPLFLQPVYRTDPTGIINFIITSKSSDTEFVSRFLEYAIMQSMKALGLSKLSILYFIIKNSFHQYAEGFWGFGVGAGGHAADSRRAIDADEDGVRQDSAGADHYGSVPDDAALRSPLAWGQSAAYPSAHAEGCAVIGGAVGIFRVRARC